MSRRCFRLLLALSAFLFVTALWGSVYCGLAWEQTTDAARHTHLRHMIYFHFGVAQLALAAGALFFYLRHRAWKRYYLLVSYNEKGTSFNPPGIRMPRGRVCRCHLGNLATAELPPADAPVLVYPLFMQSGSSSGRKLTAALEQAYAARGEKPHLFYQPVLGASPWLARAAADTLRPQLAEDTGVLVVAHGSRLPEPPPEPALFCRRLRELLPGMEIRLGYFHQEPEARALLPQMKSSHILVLPFLLTEGVHTTRDIPTAADAAACGKTLTPLPVAASLLTADRS